MDPNTKLKALSVLKNRIEKLQRRQKAIHKESLRKDITENELQELIFESDDLITKMKRIEKRVIELSEGVAKDDNH